MTEPHDPDEGLNTEEVAEHAGRDRARRHVRFRTRQSARLLFAEGSAVDCEIRDFNRQGLTLVTLDRADAEAKLHSHQRSSDHVEIEFPLDGADGGRFRLQARLVHASASGFGIDAGDMTNEAYEALVAARTDNVIAGAPTTALLPEESLDVLRDCMQLFHLGLAQTWRDFLDGIAIKVAERDTATLALTDHSRYLGALAALLAGGDELGRRHFALVVERMRAHGERTAPAPAETDESELAMVDDNNFDDWLNIANIFNRLEADNRSAMFQFAQRFNRVIPVPIDRHTDPFGPESVCLAFQECVSELDLSNAMRALIYRAFGEALAPHYPPLYERLNLLLAPFKPIAWPRPAAYAPEPPRVDTAGHAEVQPAASVADQIAKLAEVADRLYALYPGAGEAPAPTPAAPPPGSEVAALQVLEQTLLQRLQRQAGTSPRVPPVRSSIPIEQLLAAVSAPATEPSITAQMAAAIGQPGSAERLSQPQREALSVATTLMTQAMTEHGGHSDIDNLLQRLERPLYEQLLAGDDPLGREDHPLRGLINLVDAFAVVADDQGRFLEPDLGELVATVIDHAVEKSSTDPGSFAEARATLEKLLKYPAQARRQRLAGHQEMCEAQEALRHAKRLLAEQLDQRLSGRRLPRIVLSLLDQGLRQHLLASSLRGDVDEVGLSLRLTEALLSPSPPSGDPDGDLDRIEQRLRAANPNGRELDGFMAELRSHLAHPEAGPLVQLPPGWFAAELGVEPATGKGAEPAASLASLGDWWQIGPPGEATSMQVIWASRPPGAYGLVNRSATRRSYLTQAEFAKQIAEGRAQRGENRDLPLLERSEHGVVDGMYRRLAHRAHHDPVTNLLNRKGLIYAADRLPNRSGHGHLICVLELDPFRLIVDTCGGEAGERLTREIGAILQRCLGPADRAAVIGDGLFAVLVPDLRAADGRQFAERLIQAMAGYHFQHELGSYAIKARLGLAGLIPGVTEPAEVLRRAGAACSTAREAEGASVQVYEDSGDLLRERVSLMDWGRRLDSLLAGDTLFLRCQQVAPLDPETTLPPYYEVLLGVRDDEGRVVSPQPFVEAVEHWKRAHDLDLWVIEHTFAWIRANPAAFAATGGFSINLSALSMSDTSILATLHGHLAQGDIPPEKIIFEITETATVNSYDSAREFIRQIRRYGCRFCIDDFGSGHASYGYLLNLRTDTLKIDGAFVRDMVDDPDLVAMVRSMNEIGHSLGMKTVAEFVANPEILALIREIGVDYAQGYEIEQPVHIDELARR